MNATPSDRGRSRRLSWPRNAPGDLARVLSALAKASLPLVHLIRRGRLAGALDAAVGPAHDGLAQKALDVFADEAFVNGLKGAGVRGVAVRGARESGRNRRRRNAAGGDRSARRLLEHRRQHLDRHLLFGAGRADRRICKSRISFSLASSSAQRASSSTGRTSRSSSRPARASARRRSIRTRTPTGCRASASASRRIPTSSPSTPRIPAIGRSRCAPMSRIASRATKVRAGAISTCAGSPRPWPTSIGSWRAAASTSIRRIRDRATSTGDCACSTRPIRSPSSSNRRAVRQSTAFIASSTSSRPPSTRARR